MNSKLIFLLFIGWTSSFTHQRCYNLQFTSIRNSIDCVYNVPNLRKLSGKLTMNASNKANKNNQGVKLDTSNTILPPLSKNLESNNDNPNLAKEVILDPSQQPNRLGPFQRLKKLLLITAPVIKKLVGGFFQKWFPRRFSNANSPKNGYSGSPKLRKGGILDLFTKTVYPRLTSRKFWMQFIILVTSVVMLNKTMKAYASLVTEISYSSFLKLIALSPERISSLKVSPFQFSYILDGRQAAVSRTVQLPQPMIERLLASGIEFSAASSPINIFGLFTTLAYLFYLYRMSKSMMGPPEEGVGKRKDGRLEEYGALSFNDIAGQDKAKQEVSEICTMLKHPERYSNVGARLPAGVLLVGPPGTGKTLLARVTAAEANVPFYSCSGSDFVEVFVGRGPARVRQLFKQAAKNAPSIIFIDELDSIGRSRRFASMNSEQESTLNQLLTAMDGLDTSNNGVIVMAATNRYELLDPALLRAGRFDRIVQCPLPDRLGRLSILNVHTRRLQLDKDIDLDRIARLTPGTCGADLATIVNEAAIRTARRGGAQVSSLDFDEALRTYFSGRGVSLSGLTSDMAGVQIPAWLKQLANGGQPSGNEPQPQTNF